MTIDSDTTKRTAWGCLLLSGDYAALLLLMSLTVSCAVDDVPTAAHGSPNVVLLVADDLGYGDVSYLGGGIPTPSIDSFMQAGVCATAGYVTSSVCNPSRAGLMTGRYSQRWGQELNSQSVPPIGSPLEGLTDRETTIAQVLHDAGYATGMIGKWQFGLDGAQHPLARGFDYFFGHDSYTDYVDSTWDGVQRIQASEVQEPESLQRNRDRVELEAYLTKEHAREAVEFIERHEREPFFLYVAFFAPHPPYQVTQEEYDRNSQLEHERRIYAGMVSAVDDAVGSILNKLQVTGLDEQTLVIFLSDNGAPIYAEHIGASNKPFVGYKGTLYDGGLRVPFAMRWNGEFGTSSDFEQPISSLDVFPTILEAAKLEHGSLKLDGVSLLPYLRNDSQGAPDRMLFWRAGPNSAARWNEWKLLRTDNAELRLVDLSRDSNEAVDRSDDNPRVVQKMRFALEAWEGQLAPARSGERTVTTNFHDQTIRWHL